MRRILTVGILTVLLFPLSMAQKKQTILGDTWTGQVVATDDRTREITIEYPGKDKPEKFSGVLRDGYELEKRDGSSFELKVSDIPVGMRVRLFVKTKEEEVKGQKVKVNRISRIDFLGKDDYAWLRGALKLDQATPVKLDESGRLSPARPLKINLVIEDEGIKTTFVDWTTKWNAEQAGKYGALEIVPTLEAADISLVVLKGSPNMIWAGGMIGADGRWNGFSGFSVFLTRLKEGQLEVLWKQVLLSRTDHPKTEKGRIEKEIEKRLKERS